MTNHKSSKDTNTAAANFVTFSAEELKALDVESLKVIDLESFVPRSGIDPVYFSTPIISIQTVRSRGKRFG